MIRRSASLTACADTAEIVVETVFFQDPAPFIRRAVPRSGIAGDERFVLLLIRGPVSAGQSVGSQLDQVKSAKRPHHHEDRAVVLDDDLRIDTVFDPDLAASEHRAHVLVWTADLIRDGVTDPARHPPSAERIIVDPLLIHLADVRCPDLRFDRFTIVRISPRRLWNDRFRIDHPPAAVRTAKHPSPGHETIQRPVLRPHDARIRRTSPIRPPIPIHDLHRIRILRRVRENAGKKGNKIRKNKGFGGNCHGILLSDQTQPLALNTSIIANSSAVGPATDGFLVSE